MQVWAPTAISPRTRHSKEVGRDSIWQIDRATGAHREYATGLRNPNGLQFEPQTHVLWAVVNERDELGPDLVPDYLTSVQDGAFYGWPYSHMANTSIHAFSRSGPIWWATAIAPDRWFRTLPHWGSCFICGTDLPAHYRGGAFVGEHGSWDRAVLNGYKVVYIPFVDGRPSGPPEDVVTGFLADGDKARGRPVGLAVDGRGGLLIADDTGNSVWRVTAASP